MNAFLSTVRRISWLVALGALLFGVSLLDKALGTGRAMLGVAAGLSVAGGTLLFLLRRMGRLAQRAADDQRKRLKPPPFPEDPYASYDWKVRTLAGKPFSMEEVRREVLFLNFWSTACPPCLSELPSIQRLHDGLAAEGVVFMCIALDSQIEPVREVLARNNLTVPVFVLEDDRIPAVFDSEYIPSTFFVDADGRVRYQHQGAALWDHPRVSTFLRGLLMQDIVRQVVK